MPRSEWRCHAEGAEGRCQGVLGIIRRGRLEPAVPAAVVDRHGMHWYRCPVCHTLRPWRRWTPSPERSDILLTIT